MFRGKGFIVLLCAWVLSSCAAKPDIELPVHNCATMPSGGRACATCFVYDGQAYFFAGRDTAETYHNDLWRYNPSTDKWEDLGTTPLSPRVNAAACVYDDKVYIGLGFCGKYSRDTSYLRDWWEYNPLTNDWTRRADYPNYYTDRATAFTGDGELYVGYGFCWNYRRDMFRYTIADNRWDSIDVGVSFHGYPTRSFGGTGCTCQGRHFMGTGYYRESLNWWAEFIPEGRWEKRKAVPGRARTIAASAATGSYVYVCGGLHYGGANTDGEVLQDVQRYNPQTDQWQWVAVMPERMMNHCCFAINGKVYFGLGEDEDYHVSNRLYYIEE